MRCLSYLIKVLGLSYLRSLTSLGCLSYLRVLVLLERLDLHEVLLLRYLTCLR